MQIGGMEGPLGMSLIGRLVRIKKQITHLEILISKI